MIASTTLKLPDLYKAADDAIGELRIARGNAVFQRNQNLKDQLVVDMPIDQESQLVEDQRAERSRKLKAVGSDQAQPSCSPDVLEVWSYIQPLLAQTGDRLTLTARGRSTKVEQSLSYLMVRLKGFG